MAIVVMDFIYHSILGISGLNPCSESRLWDFSHHCGITHSGPFDVNFSHAWTLGGTGAKTSQDQQTPADSERNCSCQSSCRSSLLFSLPPSFPLSFLSRFLSRSVSQRPPASAELRTLRRAIFGHKTKIWNSVSMMLDRGKHKKCGLAPSASPSGNLTHISAPAYVIIILTTLFLLSSFSCPYPPHFLPPL